MDHLLIGGEVLTPLVLVDRAQKLKQAKEAAAEAIQEFRDGLEKEFNSNMNSVGEFYKFYALLFIFGVLGCVF